MVQTARHPSIMLPALTCSHLFTTNNVTFETERIPVEKATLTISLPRTMKDYIAAKLREGRFSTPSEYIRSLIRDEQDMTAKAGLAVLARRGIMNSPEATMSQRVKRKK
jgi:Arc/MetJ-type ribon-helix-helix transcriptional regulator